ncbi:MAG TPA: TrkA C-terminal domain-containing protein, partial [Chryseolinea sp.]|nr:TrkA C-terminal domain-containing protein [Chryseolinea sp.]
SEFLYPITVAVSAISTFTTPYLITFSGPLHKAFEKFFPELWVSAINRYSSGTQQLSGISDWNKLLRSYVMNFIVHSVILIGIILLSSDYLYPFILRTVGKDISAPTIITVIIILLLMAPFLWALAIRRIQKEAYSHLWLNRKLNRGPLIALELLRIAVAIFHVGFLLSIFFSTSVGILIATISMVIAIFLFRRKLQAFYDRLEKRFLYNLNERELHKTRPAIVPWDAHLAEFQVLPESNLIGKELQEIALRERFGINVALIERGKKTIVTPGRTEKLFPGDTMSVIGTDEQLGKLKHLLDQSALMPSEHKSVSIQLRNFTITEESPLRNKTIRDSGIRESAMGLIVGVERNGERLLNPESTFKFRNGDIVWIVGEEKHLESYLRI